MFLDVFIVTTYPRLGYHEPYGWPFFLYLGCL